MNLTRRPVELLGLESSFPSVPGGGCRGVGRADYVSASRGGSGSPCPLGSGRGSPQSPSVVEPDPVSLRARGPALAIGGPDAATTGVSAVSGRATPTAGVTPRRRGGAARSPGRPRRPSGGCRRLGVRRLAARADGGTPSGHPSAPYPLWTTPHPGSRPTPPPPSGTSTSTGADTPAPPTVAPGTVGAPTTTGRRGVHGRPTCQGHPGPHGPGRRGRRCRGPSRPRPVTDEEPRTVGRAERASDGPTPGVGRPATLAGPGRPRGQSLLPPSTTDSGATGRDHGPYPRGECLGGPTRRDGTSTCVVRGPVVCPPTLPASEAVMIRGLPGVENRLPRGPLNPALFLSGASPVPFPHPPEGSQAGPGTPTARPRRDYGCP